MSVYLTPAQDVEIRQIFTSLGLTPVHEQARRDFIKDALGGYCPQSGVCALTKREAAAVIGYGKTRAEKGIRDE